MKIITVVGARPQFIKASALSRVIALHKDLDEVILHTGQHYDQSMSSKIFDELQIPTPKYNLGISSINHGAMTGRMIEEIEKIIYLEKPDWMLLYGDTNSTLAGAIAASKMKIKIAHVEAGLRSDNLAMPEEVNRILTDRVSDLLLCSTKKTEKTLKQEGYPYLMRNGKKQKITYTGDIMLDVLINNQDNIRNAELDPNIKENGDFILLTLHRQETGQTAVEVKNIIKYVYEIAGKYMVKWPMHPRMAKILKGEGIEIKHPNIKITEPIGYIATQALIKNAVCVITDSGGIQKEAYWHKTQCITLRTETEWVETIENGYNQLMNINSQKTLKAIEEWKSRRKIHRNCYGDGNASQKIIKCLIEAEGLK